MKVDERKITALFRDAVHDVPPASFNQEDVAAESARLTRKRNSLIAGSALGFVLLAGIGVASVTVFSDTTAQQTGSAAAGGNDSRSLSENTSDSGKAADAPGLSAKPPLQGGGSPEKAGPTTGGTPGGCTTADRELAAALAGELPAATSTGDVVVSPLACPTGARSAAFGVQDGPRRGFLSIMLVPANTAMMQQPPWAARPSGTEGTVVTTKSKQTLVVAIEPVAGSAAPPIDDATARRIADKLAGRY